jgi:hypothetical protein
MAKTWFIIGTSGGFGCQLNELPLERGEKTTSIPSAASICRSVFKSNAEPPCGAPIILDEGHRPRRATDSFIRAVRVFLSGPVGSSAFQEVSLGREVSVVFTSNGPLIYRWEGNNSNNGRPRTVNAYQTFYNVAQRGKPENRLPIMATNSIQSADR